MEKLVYRFQEGSKDMSILLGGKGANLAEMTNLGLPVPSGFTITTEACRQFYQTGKKLSDDLLKELEKEIAALEVQMGKNFGDVKNPLLVSVRSGSVFSMPGMMDTILNLGLNNKTVVALAEATQNERFAYDSYRRFIQMFSDVVMHVPREKFEKKLEQIKAKNNYKIDADIPASDLKKLVQQYKEIYQTETQSDFPEEPKQQLLLAVEAVFSSWDNARAKVYRQLNDIPDHLGTAVNIQSMVFGNMGDTSGTGVAFTRNPSTGEAKLFGEFLMNAQGEDVVAGIRTPESIDKLRNIMPHVYDEFVKITSLLENHYLDMQDIEFTVETGKLFILQTRNGKRTAQASIKIAVDLVEEKLITKKQAMRRVSAKQIEQILHPTFDVQGLKQANLITSGLPASPGAASGKVYFHADDVVAAKKRGETCILARLETSPEDIEGMVSSAGILTSRGGMTSHAAVVARGMGLCCIAGCSTLTIDEKKKEISYGDIVIKEGDYISLDGGTGKVYLGEIPYDHNSMGDSFKEFMSWTDEFSKLEVRANADTPKDVQTAIHFGVTGIGLCRTEHMFFNENRIFAVRQMILAESIDERQKALDQLLLMQKEDFIQLFTITAGKPVNIRLLDPPLHEFLPKTEDEINKLAEDLSISTFYLKQRLHELSEVNPMLGHRGCRLGITYPEIYNMQAKAIIESAIVIQKSGIEVAPEIMIPFIGSQKEYNYVKDNIAKTIEDILQQENIQIGYQIGTMIEIPRACLTADEIAKEAEFFSFGTNDLTQMTYGFSRDDSEKFSWDYIEKGIMKNDPFQTLDFDGVGELISIACKKGRVVKPALKIGVCGEVGGDPASIRFFHELGLSYVSCSPYRVPVAKLVAAQVAIDEPFKK
ncbi:pyruvate, phosphate dikinase [Brevibacillus daliensis]|uniref:pyruvate, phosphate dikinase n=1 Tax=Brevibacillus daliensis TaxID=2892995 RepID=UPI001E54058B|nr:pyruvate, phosphate dikinase [Brevibacillus daliensis]